MLTEILKPYIQTLPSGIIANSVNVHLQKYSRLVITAPPGAGKSTLLPLTILQNTPKGKIIILEPRRLAARQIARRMASMIRESVGETVGYRIRFEQKISPNTRIEVLTEGILTRMLIEDPTLDGVSTIIFDEFHERSLASDTALALTREAQQIVRPDIKIVIMSATIDTTAICQALDAPLLKSEGKRYDVEIIHCDEANANNCAELTASVIRRAHNQHHGDILAFLPGQAEINKCKEILGESLSPTAIYPLYGMLSVQEQNAAITPSKDDERKIVLATPVAETSLTIEGVRIVVDSGLHRATVFNTRNSLSHLETIRISIDMANQRSGRAGRVANGVCYRLWSKATELRMRECRKPEILEADLSSITLAISAWGESDIKNLPWITIPPTAHAQQAKQLLYTLGAIDSQGIITPHGKLLSKFPCHPRTAQMLTKANTPRMKALAADIAAILEEKDPMPQDYDADINSRIIMLREKRQRKQQRNWGRIINIAEQYRKLAGHNIAEDNTIPSPYDSGSLIASAYPERIAIAIDNNRYKLATGDTVSLNSKDDLCAQKLLAIASLDTRIFLASPLDMESLRCHAKTYENIYWDNRIGKVITQSELRIGLIVLESHPASNTTHDTIVKVICDAAKKDGISMLDFNNNVQLLQQRLAVVNTWHPELALPDVSTEVLLAQTSQWMPLYIGNASTVAELKKINLCDVIWGMLTYDQQQEVEHIAPSHIPVPTGSKIRVDYRQGAEAPVLSVRLQECFGLTDTPCVDKGKRPVLMELLSPGYKPVQLTQDLHSFWNDTYFEVRKDLRRRYPKHYWPDNPLEAEAVKGVKKKHF